MKKKIKIEVLGIIKRACDYCGLKRNCINFKDPSGAVFTKCKDCIKLLYDVDLEDKGNFFKEEDTKKLDKNNIGGD